MLSATRRLGNAIVPKTCNTAAQPSADALNDLGSLGGTHKVLTAGEIVKRAIANGDTARLRPWTAARSA